MTTQFPVDYIKFVYQKAYVFITKFKISLKAQKFYIDSI